MLFFNYCKRYFRETSTTTTLRWTWTDLLVRKSVWILWVKIPSVSRRVLDPHWFQCGSGSGSSILCQGGSGFESGSRSRVLMTKDWKQFTAEKKYYFFDKKIAIYLHAGRPSYKRILQVSKEKIQHFKIWNFFPFYIFVGHFCSPGSGSRSSRQKSMRIHASRIRIRNTNIREHP